VDADAGFWTIALSLSVVATSGFVGGVKAAVGNAREHNVKKTLECTAFTALMGALAALMMFLIYTVVVFT